MNKKGQNIILKEVFVFVIGIILAASIGAIFSDLISPEIRDFTIDKKMDQFLNHVDFVTTRVYIETVEIGDEINITYRLSLPDELSGSKYTMTVEGRDICIRIAATGDKKCRQSSLPEGVKFSGDAFSGVSVQINAYKSDSETSITLSNI